jgi:tetratricopeptide (TPR) repeat protein
MKLPDSITRRGAGAKPGSECPEESEILGYFENKLSPQQQDSMRNHLVDCSDCRELVALFVQTSSGATEGQGRAVATSESLSDLAVRNQTARVLAMIERDEMQMAAKSSQTAPSRPRILSGFFPLRLAFAGVSLIAVCAIAISVYVLTRSASPDTQATKALALARSDQRNIEPRTSADLPYARYPETRGDQVSALNEMQFDRALNFLRFAEDPSAPPASRLVLAQAYLERARPDDIDRARTILSGLESSGSGSVELLNDIGVVWFQSRDYERAASYFERALGLQSNYNPALFNIALTHERLHRNSDAIREWQQFLSTSADQKWKDEAQSHLENLENSRGR